MEINNDFTFIIKSYLFYTFKCSTKKVNYALFRVVWYT
jgi:hypothetical protein